MYKIYNNMKCQTYIIITSQMHAFSEMNHRRDMNNMRRTYEVIVFVVISSGEWLQDWVV